MSCPIRKAVLLGLAGALALPAVGSAAVGDITEFPVTGANPTAITAGPDGNLWLAQYTDNSVDPLASGVGKITLSGAYTGYTTGIEPNSGPTSITRGPDGNLWYTREFNPVPALMKLTTLGSVSDVASFPAGARAASVITGPDGNLWLSIIGSIVRSTTGGATNSFALPGVFNQLTGLTVGPDGAIWGVSRQDDALTRTTTAGVSTLMGTFTAGSQPSGITTGADGHLWVTLQGTTPSSIARVSTAGAMSTFAVPSNARDIRGVTTGPDGNVWFTERDTGRIARVTPSGAVTEYIVPGAGADPTAITAGPDGNVWFTELTQNKVGRVLTGVTPSSTAAPAVTGTPRVGQVLTVSNGTWNYTPTGYAYSWQRCASAAGATCSGIGGQSASTYTVTRADVGKFLIASVTATSLNGPSQASTAVAVQVASLPRLAGQWSRTTTTRKRAMITGLVTPRAGVTGYRVNAVLTSGPNAYRSDANTRSGRCVSATVKLPTKKGKKPRTVRRQRCAITLPIGAWTVTVEGSRGTELLAYTSKAYRIR